MAAVLAVVYLIFNEGCSEAGVTSRRRRSASAAPGRPAPGRGRGAGAAGPDAPPRRPTARRGFANGRWSSCATRTATSGTRARSPRSRCAGTTLTLGGRGPYALQAAIAALHTEEPPDWPRDRRPLRRAPRASPGSPVVEADRAVAVAERRAMPRRRSVIVDGLDPRRLPLPALRPGPSLSPSSMSSGGGAVAFGRALAAFTATPSGRGLLEGELAICRRLRRPLRPAESSR